MQVAVESATGVVLNWMVAQCEGFPSTIWHSVPMPEDYTCHCGLYVHPAHRNWKAIHIEDCPEQYRYSTDWAQGGPIIDREIHNLFKWNQIEPGPEIWCAVHNHKTPEGIYALQMDGPTMLIAAMRCYVLAKLGPLVEVPDELC